MKVFCIRLRSMEDVQEFVALANTQPFDVSVGNEYQNVNGKSFMGMFCLDQHLPQQVRVECSEEEFRRFYEAAERFRV